MKQFGQMLFCESSTERLIHRVFLDENAPGGQREWLGFRVSFGTDVLSFPLVYFLPTKTSGGGRPLVRDCILASLEVVSANEVIVYRPGLPPCRFIDGFCEQSQETLVMDENTDAITLTGADGNWYVFDADLDWGIALKLIAFPDGSIYQVSHEANSIVLQSSRCILTIVTDVVDQTLLRRLTFEGQIGEDDERILFDVIYRNNPELDEFQYDCDVAWRFNHMWETFSLTVFAPLQDSIAVSNITIVDGTMTESVSSDYAHLGMASSSQSDRVPILRTESLIPISQGAPFLVSSKDGSDPRSFVALSESGRPLSSFSRENGLCSSTRYHVDGRPLCSISSVPFTWLSVISSAIGENPLFQYGSSDWSLSVGASVALVTALPIDVDLSPVLGGDQGRLCALLPGNGKLTKDASSQPLLSDCPYSFCFLVAPDPQMEGNESLSLTATISLNGGGTATRSVTLHRSDLCPGYPTLAFLDLSTAEGATGFSVSIESHINGYVAVPMGALFPIPVSQTAPDPGNGLPGEELSGTSYSKRRYEGDLLVQTIGDASSELTFYDSLRRPRRSVTPDGGNKTVEFAGDTIRPSTTVYITNDGDLTERLASYSGPWNQASSESGPYGLEVQRTFDFDGATLSLTKNQRTKVFEKDHRGRSQKITFSKSTWFASHIASYGNGSFSVSVSNVTGSLVETTSTFSQDGHVETTAGHECSSWRPDSLSQPDSIASENAGSLSFAYSGSDSGVPLLTSTARFASSQVDVVLPSYFMDGSVLFSIGPDAQTVNYRAEAFPDPSMFRSWVGLDRGGPSRYLSLLSGTDPVFGGSSIVATTSGAGEECTEVSPDRPSRGCDYPSLFQKMSMAGSTTEDLFALAASEQPPAGVSFVDGVPCRLTAAPFQRSGGAFSFAILLKFEGQTLFADLLLDQSETELFRYQGGYVRVLDGEYVEAMQLSGWHCLAFAIGLDGRGTLFLDDARVNFDGTPFLRSQVSLTASSPIRSCVALNVGSKWSDGKLYEAVRDCLAVPLPPKPQGRPREASRSTVHSHVASGTDTLARFAPLDGTVLLGSWSPCRLGGARLIQPLAQSLCLGAGGPRRVERFRRDPDTGRLAWACCGDALSYRLEGRTFGLKASFKPFPQIVSPGRRYLFHVGEGMASLSLYLLNGIVWIDAFGELVSTGLSMPEGQWSDVCLRMTTAVSPSTQSSPGSAQVSYSVTVGFSLPFTQIKAVPEPVPEEPILDVGWDGGSGSGLSSRPFLGLVSSLWYTPRDHSVSSLSEMEESTKSLAIDVSYDALGRPIGSELCLFVLGPIVESLSYDAPAKDLDDGRGVVARQTGNLVGRTLSCGSWTLPGHWSGPPAESYGRDPNTGELTSIGQDQVSYNGAGFLSGFGDEAFTYRDDGSILTRSNGGTTKSYSYDALGRLSAIPNHCTLSYPSGSLFPSGMYRFSSYESLYFTYFAAGKVRSASVASSTYTFDYGEDGRRRMKTYPDGSVRLYRYDGDRLIYESVPGSFDLFYGYDPLGRPAWMDLIDGNGTHRFLILCDGLNRIRWVVDEAGEPVLTMSYDAFGTPTVLDQSGIGLSSKSSLRFKGYVYDQETKLYFLGFRFYDPQIGRFLSPDSPSNLEFGRPGGLNPYVYCLNDPISLSDPGGDSVLVALLIAAGVGALSSMAGQLVSDVIVGVRTGKWNFSWQQYVGAAVGGAIGGALGAMAAFASLGVAADISIGFLSSATSTFVGDGLEVLTGTREQNWPTFWAGVLCSGLMGSFGAGVVKIKYTENLTSRFLTAAQRIPGETLRSASWSILQGFVANVVNSYPDILYSVGFSLAEERGFI